MNDTDWWRAHEDALETAIRGAGITGVPSATCPREDELHVHFGRHGLRWVVLRPSKHDGVFLAELCGYAGA